MINVYLAARFSRRAELIGYAAELEQHGRFHVTSRWLFTDHEWSGADDSRLPVEVGSRFASEDLADVDAADLVVCFTELPRASASRGGRHVEVGYALALSKMLVLVGPRENVFYCLPRFVAVPDWPAAMELLTKLPAGVPNPSYCEVCLVALFPGDPDHRGRCRSCAASEGVGAVERALETERR